MERSVRCVQEEEERLMNNKTNSPSGGFDIASSKKHAMDYVVRAEIIRALRLANEADWYLFMIKEKLDNSCDFLWKYYPSAPPEQKVVDLKIKLDYKHKLFDCTVTNKNPENKPVFTNLDRILDFNMTYGTKQNDFRLSR